MIAMYNCFSDDGGDVIDEGNDDDYLSGKVMVLNVIPCGPLSQVCRFPSSVHRSTSGDDPPYASYFLLAAIIHCDNQR